MITYRQKYSEDGKKLIVMRPSNPELAIKLATEATAVPDMKKAAELFSWIPNIVQESGGAYQFVGWLAKRAGSLKAPLCVCDEHMKYLCEIEPGDSFMDEEVLENSTLVGSA